MGNIDRIPGIRYFLYLLIRLICSWSKPKYSEQYGERNQLCFWFPLQSVCIVWGLYEASLSQRLVSSIRLAGRAGGAGTSWQAGSTAKHG